MPKTKMFRAIRPLKYLTRQLVAGDLIEAPYETKRDRMTVTALLASRKVREVRAPVDVPPPPPAVKAQIEAAVAPAAPPLGAVMPLTTTGNREAEKQASAVLDRVGTATAKPASQVDDDILKARAEYREALGKTADARWSAATVRSKMAAKDESGS